MGKAVKRSVTPAPTTLTLAEVVKALARARSLWTSVVPALENLGPADMALVILAVQSPRTKFWRYVADELLGQGVDVSTMTATNGGAATLRGILASQARLFALSHTGLILPWETASEGPIPAFIRVRERRVAKAPAPEAPAPVKGRKVAKAPAPEAPAPVKGRKVARRK